MTRRLRLLLGLAATLAATDVWATPPSASRWVATWRAAMQAPAPNFGTPDPRLSNVTVREIVRTSVGGGRVRVRISNLYGKGALDLGDVRIARSAGGARTAANSDAPVTFGGTAQVRLAPGSEVTSDAVGLVVPPGSDLAVSLYVRTSGGPATWHEIALADGYVSPKGDFAAKQAMPIASVTGARLLLTQVDVEAAPCATIVAFGDSITDGAQSTAGANRRWPDDLARRLGPGFAVVNSGISGNRLLRGGYGESGAARFARDVLAVPGVTHAVVLLGTNDLVTLFAGEAPASSDAVVAGLRRLAARAKAAGVKLIGATLVPRPAVPEAEPARQAVNAAIRELVTCSIRSSIGTRYCATPSIPKRSVRSSRAAMVRIQTTRVTVRWRTRRRSVRSTERIALPA